MSGRQVPPDPIRRRYQLHFLLAALEYALPHVQEIERAARELQLPAWGVAGEPPAQQLHRLRELATDTVLSEGVTRTA